MLPDPDSHGRNRRKGSTNSMSDCRTPVYGEGEDTFVRVELPLSLCRLFGTKCDEHGSCIPPFAFDCAERVELKYSGTDRHTYPLPDFDRLAVGKGASERTPVEGLIEPHANLVEWIIVNEDRMVKSVLDAAWGFARVMAERYPELVGAYFSDLEQGRLWCGHVFHETVQLKSIRLGADPSGIGVEVIQHHNLISDCEPLCELLSMSRDSQFGVLFNIDTLEAVAGPAEILADV